MPKPFVVSVFRDTLKFDFEITPLLISNAFDNFHVKGKKHDFVLQSDYHQLKGKPSKKILWEVVRGQKPSDDLLEEIIWALENRYKKSGGF